MTDRFEAVLDESISALQAGVPIEEILAEVPDYADELRPLLYAATILTNPKPTLIPEERKLALRTEYKKQAATLPAAPPLTLGEKAQAILRILRRRLTRDAIFNDLITIIITVSLTLIMGVLILNFLANDALPGDFLFGVKRISESVQLSLSFNDDYRVGLEEKFNQRRLLEIEQLIDQNRAALVQFRGILETKGENLWIVEGHTVFLPDDVSIRGNIQEGDKVEVIGLLRTNNVLVADTIKTVE